MQNTVIHTIITPTVVSTAVGQTPVLASTTTGIDPTVQGAIIGAVATILAGLIAGIFIVYQMRRSARDAKTIARYQQELERQFKTSDQKEQQEAEKAENLRTATLLAKTNEERIDLYRKSLQVDPYISCLQILSMSRPLGVMDVYIRVRLHEETRAGYVLEPMLLAAENDPNMLFKLSQKHLEGRFGNAIDPDEAIRRFQHCVILGDPGAGKTTLLKYLTLKAAQKQLVGLPDLPIHISLNDFVSSKQQDLLDFAAATWEQRYGFPQADARIYIEERLKRGQALLLLDALDETVAGNTGQEAEASYRSVAETIIQAKTRYYQAPIVVTARKAGYHAHTPLLGFTEVEVLDFRQEDIEQFITRWFALYQISQKQGSAPDLIERLKRNPRIQTLATNPLLLSLIVLVYQAQLELPDRRAELYKRCVDILLTEWDTSRGIVRRRDFKPEYKLQLLEELAWHFHQQGQRYFPDSEVLAVIADFLPTVNLPAEESGHVLDEIANENGLLKEQAQGWHGFLHLTLQEYFVAKYAIDHQELDTLLAHRGDPWWEEVVQLYAGQVPDASPLLQRLLESDQKTLPEDIFHTNLMVAGRCLSARPRIKQVVLREQIISRLFELLKSTWYELMRKQAAETLVMIGGKEVIAELLRLLSNIQDRNISREIAGAIGTFGEKSIVPDLLRMLLDGRQDVYVRVRIAEALGTLGDRSIVPELLKVFSDKQQNTEVCTMIARALGTLGDQAIVPELLRLLSDGQRNEYVRRAIAETLGRLGDRAIVPELLRMLSDRQQYVYVRGEVAGALGTLGDRGIVPELLRMLSDKQQDIYVRQSIAGALGTLGDRAIVSELLRMLSDGQQDENVRQSIAGALGTLGDQAIVPELLKLLLDEQQDELVRRGIAGALDVLGDRLIVPELLGLLLDERQDMYLRMRIAGALGTLGDRSIVPELLRLLLNVRENAYVRQSIADTLQFIINDVNDVKEFAIYISASDIMDVVYGGLWAISQRMRVRVIITNESTGKNVEIIKW